MSLISLATFLVAVAFALVSIYIAKILLRTAQLLKNLGQTVSQVEQQLDQTVHEVGQLIEEVEITAMDVERKLKATNGAFQSVQQIGEVTSIIGEDLQNRTRKYTEHAELIGTKKFVRAIQFAEYTNLFIKSWQRGKKASL